MEWGGGEFYGSGNASFNILWNSAAKQHNRCSICVIHLVIPKNDRAFVQRFCPDFMDIASGGAAHTAVAAWFAYTLRNLAMNVQIIETDKTTLGVEAAGKSDALELQDHVLQKEGGIEDKGLEEKGRQLQPAGEISFMKGLVQGARAVIPAIWLGRFLPLRCLFVQVFGTSKKDCRCRFFIQGWMLGGGTGGYAICHAVYPAADLLAGKPCGFCADRCPVT